MAVPDIPPADTRRLGRLGDYGLMDYRHALILATLVLIAVCSAKGSDARAQDANLYLWLRGPDDYVPESINPGRRAGASAVRLGEALKACGVKSFTIADFGLGGKEVWLPSSGNDAAIVGCVKKRVDFGFDANRALPADWRAGKRGQKVAPAESS